MTGPFSPIRKAGASRRHGRPGSPNARSAPLAKPIARTSATEEWVNGGGSTMPVEEAAPAPASGQLPSETIEGCRERAAADMLAADGTNITNQKLRFQHSAASWLVRADDIQRFNDGFKADRAASTAMWLEEEAFLAQHRQSPEEEAPNVRI